MHDMFVVLSEGPIEAHIDVNRVLSTNAGDLLIYVDGRLKLLLNSSSCEFFEEVPQTVLVACIGCDLSAIIDPVILACCPGAADAVIGDVGPGRDVEDYGPQHDPTFGSWRPSTRLAISQIDVRAAAFHHVAWPTHDPMSPAEDHLWAAFDETQRPRPVVPYDPTDDMPDDLFASMPVIAAATLYPHDEDAPF